MFSLSPLVRLVTSSFTSSNRSRCLGRSDSRSRSSPHRCRSVLMYLSVFCVMTLLRHISRFVNFGARIRSVHLIIGLPEDCASVNSTFSTVTWYLPSGTLSKSPRSSGCSARKSSSNCERSIECLLMVLSPVGGLLGLLGARLRFCRRTGRLEGFEKLAVVELDRLGQPPGAVAGLVVEARLGADHAPDERLAVGASRDVEIAVKDHVDHAEHDIARLLGQRRHDARIAARARFDLDLLGVRDQVQPVGQESELREYALELVVDDRVAFAVSQVGLVLDLVLAQDVVGAR